MSDITTTSASDPAPFVEVPAFRPGGEEHGIDIQGVHEIQGDETCTRIANAPSYVRGGGEHVGNLLLLRDSDRMALQSAIPPAHALAA